MTTATAPTAPMTGPLADLAQALIDSRLDTIERMLLGQVARADRIAIVREVEAQIHDHLAERNPDDTDRDAVIAALARLDPPEAFLPDDAGTVARPSQSPAAHRPIGRNQRVVPPATIDARPQGSLAGKVGGILGIISMTTLGLAIAAILLGIYTNAGALEIVFFGLLALDVPISLLAIAFAAYARFVGVWAVVGLVTGIISTLSLFAYAGCLLMGLGF